MTYVRSKPRHIDAEKRKREQSRLPVKAGVHFNSKLLNLPQLGADQCTANSAMRVQDKLGHV